MGRGIVRCMWLSLLPVLLGTALPFEEGDLLPTRLTTEHLEGPLGLGEAVPRFGWKPEAREPGARGLLQTAYQVQVASGLEGLRDGAADLWDSGTVSSGETYGIEYGGAELGSDRHCAWRVRIADQEGDFGPWSEPATFATGLLSPQDWGGDWIGFDAPLEGTRSPWPLERAQWIGLEGDGAEAPAGSRWFRRAFELPEQSAAAQLWITADDQWTLHLNGRPVGASDGSADHWRRPATWEVGAQLAPGVNWIAVRVDNSSPGPCGLLVALDVQLAGGARRELHSDGHWSVAAEEPRDFAGTSHDPGAWRAATELAAHGKGPWGRLRPATLHLPPTRLLRGEFELPAAAERATLYTSALGLYALELDGAAVGDERLAPGWTDYRRRVPYRAYDVTAALTAGRHVVGAELADGWYAGYVGYDGQRELYGAHTRFRAELRVRCVDGSEHRWSSDGEWRASTGGRLAADLLMGERFDARLHPAGWSRPGFDVSSWSVVDCGAGDRGTGDCGAEQIPELWAHPGPPVRAVAEFRPREVWWVAPGTYVFDLGQNFAGVVRLTVDEPAGTELTLRHAERLTTERTLYTANLRGARATDTYLCRGGGVESYEPRFTFHGFQYVEVAGLTSPPSADTVVGVAWTSDTPAVSDLETSEPLLAQLLQNIRWTQAMNFLDVPTDCPQRDERLGWTGDAQMYVRTAIWNADVGAFFTKWLTDLRDAQRADGQFPMVAPLAVAGDDGGPAWADAGVIVPLALHRAYGDRRLLERSYPSMVRFVEFCAARHGADHLPPEDFHCFGDWVSVGPDTPREVIATAYLARSAQLLAEAAAELGRGDDAARYGELAREVAAAFARTYVDGEGRVRGDTQCGLALALSFELLPAELRALAAARLAADLEGRGQFTTGFVGTVELLRALTTIGRQDLGLRLLLRREYPSWLFPLEHGATSVWERWDGWTPERGFQDPGMNSFAHYAFGAVGEWMYETLGGLTSSSPGFATAQIAPEVGGGLTWARLRHDSIRGEFRCHWRLEGEELSLDVRVPPNVLATVAVPTFAADGVTEGGRSLAQVPDVREVRREPGTLWLEVGSGDYAFRCAQVRTVDAPR
jgi:alpha-L-rhamnosidase